MSKAHATLSIRLLVWVLRVSLVRISAEEGPKTTALTLPAFPHSERGGGETRSIRRLRLLTPRMQIQTSVPMLNEDGASPPPAGPERQLWPTLRPNTS